MFFLVSPLASITGVLQALCMAPLLGAASIIESSWDDRATFDLLVAEAGTFYGGPDVILGRLLKEADRRRERLPLRAVSVGGSMLDDELLRRAENTFGITVMRAYGSSEAPFSTTTPRQASLEDRLNLDGQPNDGVQVRIGSGHDDGECLVRGPHLFLGYLDEEDNADAFEDGWFCTGDIGEFHNGQLKIVGRLKEIVIRNGLKVSMVEAERAAVELSYIHEAASYGVPDEETGERLVLAVRVVDGESVDLDRLAVDLLDQGLTKRNLPEELVIWDQPFPVTPTAKLNRGELARCSEGRPRFMATRLVSESVSDDLPEAQ